MYNHNQRINASDNLLAIVSKLSDDNTGAFMVCSNIYIKTKNDFKQMQGLRPFLDLDAMGLYGEKIWVAYKEICKEDIDTLLKKLDEDRDGLALEVEQRMSKSV